MENIHFSAETIAGFAVSGAIMVLLPILVLLVLKKKLNLKLKPVIVGAIVFLLFAIILKVPLAYPFLMADSELSRTINGSPWLTSVVAGLLAGITEETGRFLAYKTVLRSYTEKKTAIAYGIGHGGFECIYIGITMLSNIAMAVIVNSGNAASLTAGLEGAALDTAVAQLTAYSNQSFGMSMMGVVERSAAMTLQTAMSILVFAAARNKKQLWLFPFAIVFHALLDFSIVFVQLGYVNIVLFELLFIVCVAILLYCAIRFVYRKMPENIGEKI